MDELPGPAPLDESGQGLEDLVTVAAEGDGDVLRRLGPPADGGQDGPPERAGRRGLFAPGE
jgi:hypothetical protein